MRILCVTSMAVACSVAACSGEGRDAGADATIDGGAGADATIDTNADATIDTNADVTIDAGSTDGDLVPTCSRLSRSGEPLDLAALAWTNGSSDPNFPAPYGALVATGDPSFVAGMSLTYPRADDFSDGARYTFFSPWGAWDSATVIGGVRTTNGISQSCAGVGRAFEMLFNHAFIQRVTAEGPPGEPTETVGPELRQPTLNSNFITRLPKGFLLGLYSESFRPQPPQQPIVTGIFERVIEVDDDGKVIVPANQVVGCHGLFNARPGRVIDAIPLDGGQLIAVQSISAPSACPRDDQPVTGPEQIHLVLRASDGSLREGGVIEQQSRRMRDIRLYPRSDGAWLVLAADSEGSGTASIAYARLDKTGSPLTSLTSLRPPTEAQQVDFIGGASLGDRLVIAAGFAAGLDRRYALYLFDERGTNIQITDTPQLLGFVRASHENRVLVSQWQPATDGGRGTTELVRYDCALGP